MWAAEKQKEGVSLWSQDLKATEREQNNKLMNAFGANVGWLSWWLAIRTFYLKTRKISAYTSVVVWSIMEEPRHCHSLEHSALGMDHLAFLPGASINMPTTSWSMSEHCRRPFISPTQWTTVLCDMIFHWICSIVSNFILEFGNI